MPTKQYAFIYMKIISKLLIILISYYLLGIVGGIIAVLALFLGMGKLRPQATVHFINTVSAQRAFVHATFAILGYLAKADGRVSEREIQVARTLMTQMGLTGTGKQRAIETFNLGKRTDFDLTMALQTLKKATSYAYLRKLFIDIQVQAAYAEGFVDSEKQQLLQNIAAQLGCPPIDFVAIEAAMRGQAGAYTDRRERTAGRGPNTSSIAAAYSELEISPTASELEIKRAYRRLMSQNHPDKLVSKGLPAEMIKMATEKTQRVQKAYQHVKHARGL